MRPVLRAAIAVLVPAALVVAAAPSGPAATDTRADLALAQIANRRTVGVGQNIVYTVTLTNEGPDTAENVVFGDAVPDELNLVGAACVFPRGGRRPAEGEAFCHVSQLRKGESVNLIVVAVPIVRPGEEQIRNTAYIEEAATPDPIRENNTASATVRFVG